MALNRESIQAAILAKLIAATTWKTAPTRRLKDVSQVPPDMQPTAFLVESQRESGAFKGKGYPQVWMLAPAIVVYARTDDQGTAPGAVVNPLITAIEAALEDSTPSAKTPTTLGGLCSHCRVATTEIGPGYEDGQAIAVLNLEVLANA